MAANITQATASGDLVDLVSSSASATVYPNDDSILSVLQSRFRSDLPYTRIGASHLVVVNPYKTLASLNEVSAHEYEERCYTDTNLPMANSPRPLQPHVYDLAARIYLTMRRRNEHQALLSRGITGSGKSSSIRLVVEQILRLSAHKKRERKVAEQIKALHQVLDSFGNAKTVVNPNASRHGRYIELIFNERGGIAGAKALTFGLDKRRVNRLAHEERTYHVFYQFLAGATPHERDAFNLEDPSDYALLASSNCYRLPAGPFSDDGIAMDELRASLRTLGFKQKHIASIFSLLVAILLLGNIQFIEGDFHDVSAHVGNMPVLEQAARLLGVAADDLSQAMTNKTNYVRKELYTSLLNAEQSSAQRDTLMRDLYSILFAFVVETANHKLFPSDAISTPQICVLDIPGFQNRGSSGTSSVAMYGQSPLVSAYGQNGFEEFCINFADELVHSYVIRNTFEANVGYNSQMVADAVAVPTTAVMDNSACVELLRGAQLSERAHRKAGGLLGTFSKASSAFKSGKGGDQRNEDMVQDLVTRFGVHASFVASPSVGGAQDRNLFGINHYSGPCSYDASQFVEHDSDLIDSAFVTLLRNSTEPFIAKLVSGPSLAAEPHANDENIIVQAQVSSMPLRQPTIDASTDETPRLDPSKTYPVTTQLNFVMSELFASLDQAHHWNLSCIRPNDSGSSNSFDKRRVKIQVRSLLLASIASHKTVDFVADYPLGEFCERYVPRMQGSELERITQCARSNGWREGVDFAIGTRNVWLSYSAWKMVEDVLRAAEKDGHAEEDDASAVPDDASDYTHPEGGAFYDDSTSNYLLARNNNGLQPQPPMYGAGGPPTPEIGKSFSDVDDGVWGSDWDKKGGDPPSPAAPGLSKEGDMVVKDAGNAVEEVPSTRIRRFWLWLTWATTWWIPSYLLKVVGRMKRPDVRLAWREKFAICWLIFLMNCLVIFVIIGLGKVLCPQFDKAWLSKEVAEHVDSNNWWASVQGRVYDLTDFVHGDHSGLLVGIPSNGPDTLQTLAGQDLSYYFPPPLSRACQGLVDSPNVVVTPKNFSNFAPTAQHTSGTQSNYPTTDLRNVMWYETTFNTKLNKYYKGPLVWSKKEIKELATTETDPKIWALYENDLFDLTDYFYSMQLNSADPNYRFLNKDITDVISQMSGQDVTKQMKKVLAAMDPNEAYTNLVCMKNAFKVGLSDFRETPRCLVTNYLLVVFSATLMASMVLKFLAALQLGSKRSPELQDKFVICQVPCYTEGEDSLRRTIDSLTALEYDDKRKLIFIICDGNIIGSGNDRTTPRIVLDILGIDPKLDPEPLLFKSIGEGAKALNYAKVYSGLYEFQGHVVPYMVIVKVGKPTERSRPGNRGKRDSQILLMHYLNRVHFDSPMTPLELEIYHQMRNVIGIDPAFYEYIFTVDADTTVTPPALNRLVACCADDSAVIGICGETKLENPEGSWWTMIQVYEYYISHHLSKAFESLFGSVTCLPGCFSLYRIRTADKGRPIIISGRIIDEYCEPNVDTLHKKNLFSLGEDRFLTTLMMKHFPTFKTKFTPDAIAHTVAPDSFRVLFSQRRRWINSTIHNLCELVMLPELFGFCCFSMRFFVFIDLLSTIILPSTVVYIVYLIVTVATGRTAIPWLALVMIAVVYGLQAIIFIVKREFMLIGWMVVYILSYPVYSFFLPIYSFWCMDEFSWGNTRLVLGEGKDKKVVVNDDDKFDDSMIPMKKFSEYEAEAWDTGSRHSDETGYIGKSQSKAQSRGPASRNHSPPNSDYYRNTNVLNPKSSQSNLRAGGSQASHSSHPANPFASAPHLPMMPFGGSQVAGSEYGGPAGSMMQLPMMAPMGYQNTGSVYGMGMPQMMPPLGMMHTGGSFGSQFAGMAPPVMPAAQQQQQRMSTFSMATTVNPFAGGPSQNPNPTDEELFNALRMYLSTQDLMTVTKKTAREAIASRFPKADLAGRKDFLNQSIDTILSGA